MIWFVLFLICAFIAPISFVVWLAISVMQATLTCAGKILTNLANGHVLAALLYLIPAGLFLYALIEGARLAFSFYTTVFTR